MTKLKVGTRVQWLVKHTFYTGIVHRVDSETAIIDSDDSQRWIIPIKELSVI